MKQTISIKDQCSSRCDTGGYLRKDNYLGEFLTEIQKKRARDNLGIRDSEEITLNYRIVDNFFQMNELDNLEEGILCYVKQDIEDKHWYVYKNGIWEFANIGTKQVHTGIPIYTQDIIDNEVDKLPERFIKIRSDADLEGEVTEKTYRTSINGTYIDILFSALRSLQSEVAKLKNSFIYGINSYNNEDTALSITQDGYTQVDEEPLWAIEESDLSEVFTLESAQQLTPSDNIDITTGIYKISGTSYWEDSLNIIPSDSKLILYFTTNNLNILLNLTGIDIDFNTLNIPKCQTYNIMVVISRQVKNKGDNYIWITVDNYTLGQKLVEGYFNGESLQESKITFDTSYSISKVQFTDLTLSKFKLYSKAQDFSNSVIPSKPSEQDYKYNVAHITIRSVKNYSILQAIQKQLQNNELVYVEQSISNFKSGLYIKSNDKIISLSGTIINPDDPPIKPPEETMDREELIKLLQEMGILYEDNTLSLSNIGDITFIHEDSGNTYKVSIDAYGNLVSSKIPESTLQDRVDKSFAQIEESTRGFVGQLGLAEYKQEVNNMALITTDLKLYSDRVKIGAFYAPRIGNKTYGCSHAYIELENTSDKDFNLEGCYLHYAHPYNSIYKVEHLALKGILPAGGTFVIRGKYYSNDVNTFIKVDSYDQEWYINKELFDLTYDPKGAYGFALTYGNPELKYDDILVRANDGPLTGTTEAKDPYLYDPSYIDSVYFSNAIQNSSKSNYWTGPNTCMSCSVDAIFKNAFELDPAKQAFQALTTRDSSRVRNKTASDFYYIPLAKECIEFPKSEDTYPVSKFAPKASYLKKNVCTDKSKMDLQKPNMVTCSFGIDTKSTRCFNWVSAGLFDEYIWIKKQGSDTYQRFESYKHTDTQINQDTGTLFRKEFSPEINNTIYARITSRFPADNTQFTAHKCIIQSSELATTTPIVYTYVVGRADKNGNPDPEHTSEEYTFTLYPESWHPRIYQTTDQQGFHWVEYQVWNATANQLEKQIVSDFKKSPNFIPVLVNTGDMTQSGARINEWIDYYNAGKNLFKHLEQMNVVGNNDLCGTVPTELGTGDDLGKSNSYYFHIFYCYEINPDIPPIINNKYIPSLYYVDFDNYRLLFVNSEITYENCNSWFDLKLNDGVVNAYTGWRVPCISNNDRETFKQQNYSREFTPIYNMLYRMTETNKEIIALCHEMPFTVITAENLLSKTKNVSRSLSGSSLVGSHLNQLNSNDTQANYWFSRLLEYRHVKLCLGGHKHTYAATYPLREYYFYGDKNSKDDGPMRMEPTLENDFTTFEKDDQNYSKFPLMLEDKGQPTDSNNIFPYTHVDRFIANSDVNHQDGVIYFMCQASGYKLFSNKELPSVNQKFSQFIPKSTIKNGSYSASSDQRSPMFAIIDLDGNYEITLIKLLNIQKTPTTLLTPLNYGTSSIEVQSLKNVSSDSSASDDEKLYGKWVSGIDTLMVVA